MDTQVVVFGLKELDVCISLLLTFALIRIASATQLRSYGGWAEPATGQNASVRVRRQSEPANRMPIIYYLCGLFPNIVYSLTQCPICRNGGRDLGVGCSGNSAQCTQYSTGVVSCIDGRCCSVPDNNPYAPYNPYAPSGPYDPNNPYNGYNPYNDPYAAGPNYGNGQQWQYPDYGGNSPYQQTAIYGICPSGFRSNIRCSAIGQCPFSQTCLNGLCCPRTGSDYMQACGGQVALAPCPAGLCDNGLLCTPSNFCCQCPVGRSGGRCNQGGCPPGFYCTGNGFCCAQCPGNTTPFGACPNQRAELCGGGSRCSPGDLCCLSTAYPTIDQLGK